MELDPDCLRNILFTVEEHASFSKSVEMSAFKADGLLQNYGFEKLMYHIRQADLSGLTVGTKFYNIGFSIKDLSPTGHEFLSNIRNDTNWRKTKKVAAKVGSHSISVLASVASQVISSVIQKNLHLDQ